MRVGRHPMPAAGSSLLGKQGGSWRLSRAVVRIFKVASMWISCCICECSVALVALGRVCRATRSLRVKRGTSPT